MADLILSIVLVGALVGLSWWADRQDIAEYEENETNGNGHA